MGYKTLTKLELAELSYRSAKVLYTLSPKVYVPVFSLCYKAIRYGLMELLDLLNISYDSDYSTYNFLALVPANCYGRYWFIYFMTMCASIDSWNGDSEVILLESDELSEVILQTECLLKDIRANIAQTKEFNDRLYQLRDLLDRCY